MAYQRVTSSDSFTTGATAATTVINAVETGLEAAETAITTETTRATTAETNGLSWSRGYGRFSNITQTLSEGNDSFALCVLSDSTGAGTNRWPYLVAQSLATSYPAYTVHFRNWNTTNLDYDAPTVIQTGTAGARYVSPAGTNTATHEGDDTILNGVVDVRLKVSFPSWTNGSQVALVNRYFGGARVFSLQLNGTSGKLEFYYTTDGNTQAGGYGSTVATGFGAGTTNWVRCVFTPDNGSSQNTYQYYTSADGVTWTQLGTTVTVAGVVTLYQPPTFTDANAGSANYEIFGRQTVATGTSGSNWYEVEIRNGLNGALVCPRYPEHWNKLAYNSSTISGAPILTVLNSSISGVGISYFNEISQSGTAPAALTATGGTSGTNVISFAAVSGVAAGMTVTGTGVPASTTISSFTSTTITLSANLTTTASGSYTFSARGTNTINLSSTTGVVVGQTITGVGIPANTTVNSISGTLLTLSQNILAFGDNTMSFTPSTRLTKMCPTGYDVRNVLIACSHNDSGLLGKSVWGRWNSIIKQIRARLPQVPITVVSQNPETNGGTNYYLEHNRRSLMMANIAAANDASFIDVYQAFRNSSTALSSLLNSDGVHPSDAYGSPLWRDTVLAFLTKNA